MRPPCFCRHYFFVRWQWPQTTVSLLSIDCIIISPWQIIEGTSFATKIFFHEIFPYGDWSGQKRQLSHSGEARSRSCKYGHFRSFQELAKKLVCFSLLLHFSFGVVSFMCCVNFFFTWCSNCCGLFLYSSWLTSLLSYFVY